MPNLRTLELYAEELPPRVVMLSGMTATLALTCLDAANRIYDWNYDGDALTSEQIDQVQIILGDARKELMVSRLAEIIMSAAAVAPAGCLLCDGDSYDRTDYPELYAALPASFQTSADTFVVPDLRERFVYGANSIAEIGATGGEAAHVLSEDELAVHSHSIGGAGTSVAAPGAVPVLTPSIFPASTGSAGASVAHNNIPPYLVLAFYIVAW